MTDSPTVLEMKSQHCSTVDGGSIEWNTSVCLIAKKQEREKGPMSHHLH